MKCRRNGTSRGASLRGTATAAARAADDRARQQPDGGPAAPSAEPADASGGAPELRIDKITVGPISYDGAVIVGPNGRVTGGITATSIVVDGQVEGDLSATKSLRLGASASVVGDLHAPRVAVALGARLQGRLSTRQRDVAGTLHNQQIDQVLSGRI